MKKPKEYNVLDRVRKTITNKDGLEIELEKVYVVLGAMGQPLKVRVRSLDFQFRTAIFFNLDEWISVDEMYENK